MPTGDSELDALLRPPKAVGTSIDPELTSLIRTAPAPTPDRIRVASPSGESLYLNTESEGGASLGPQALANIRNFSNLNPQDTVDYLTKRGVRAWYDPKIGQVLTQEGPGEASIVNRQGMIPGLTKDLTTAAVGTYGWGLPAGLLGYGLERGRQAFGQAIGTIGKPNEIQPLVEGAGALAGGFLGRAATTVAGKAAGATPETIAEITKGTTPTQLPRAMNILRQAPEERQYTPLGTPNPAWVEAQQKAEQMGVRKVMPAPAELQQARELKSALQSISKVPGRAKAEEGISAFDLVAPHDKIYGTTLHEPGPISWVPGQGGQGAYYNTEGLKQVRVNGDALRERLAKLVHPGAIGSATEQANNTLMGEVNRIPSSMTMEDLDRYIRRDLRHSIQAQLEGKEAGGMGKLKQELLLKASHEAKTFRDEEFKRVLGPQGEQFVNAFSQASDHLGAIEDVLGKIVNSKGQLKPGAINQFRDFLSRPETGFRDALLWLDEQMAKNGMPTQFAKRAQEQAMRRQLDMSNVAALQDIVRGRPQTRKGAATFATLAAKAGAATMFTSPVFGRRATEAFQRAFAHPPVPPASENP